MFVAPEGRSAAAVAATPALPRGCSGGRLLGEQPTVHRAEHGDGQNCHDEGAGYDGEGEWSVLARRVEDDLEEDEQAESYESTVGNQAVRVLGGALHSPPCRAPEDRPGEHNKKCCRDSHNELLCYTCFRGERKQIHTIAYLAVYFKVQVSAPVALILPVISSMLSVCWYSLRLRPLCAYNASPS